MWTPATLERGILYIILGGSEYNSVAHRVRGGMLLRNVVTTISLGLVVALAAAFFVLTTQTRKLRRLAAAIDTFRASNFEEFAAGAGCRRDAAATSWIA